MRIDVVPFPMGLLEEDALPRGPTRATHQFSQIDLMQYLARFKDSQATAFLVKAT